MWHSRLVFCLVTFASPAYCGAQQPFYPPPTETDVTKQIRRLDLENTEAERLQAAKWLNLHSKAKHAHLAMPALERCIRTDPVPEVRDAAVFSLTWIAKNRNDPFPLVIAEAMLDKDEYVRQTAEAVAYHFTEFAPGCLEILLRLAESDDENRRANCLVALAVAGRKNKKVLDVLDKATRDKCFSVRHNAYCAKFQATDNLEELLHYIIRLQEDPVGILGHADVDSAAARQDNTTREMGVLWSAETVAKWAETRPDELAAALYKFLSSPSPVIRRGAVRHVRASAVKVDLTKRTGESSDNEGAEAKRRTSPEPSKAALQLEKLNVRARLRELSENDPDLRVSLAAAVALEVFTKALEKKD